MPRSNTVIRFFVLVLLVAVCPSAWAQSAPHQHPQADLNMIDGSAHPELVPDAVAYRLYLVAISQGSSAATASHLKKANLTDADVQAMTVLLASFRSQYEALIDQYNNSLEVKNGSDSGWPLFRAKREALVQSIRDALKASLTSAGMASLHSQIQKEKAMMKVAATEGQ
jgi:hypothetical protein